MDTDWFAVDDDGRVAQFSSYESGAAPLVAIDPPYIDELRDFEMEYGSRPAVLEQIEESESGELRPDEPAMRGAYHYTHGRYDSYIATPYTRRARPLEPMRVDELPPALRDSCLRFEGARFECDVLIQPLDFYVGRSDMDIPYLSVRAWALRRFDERGRRRGVPLFPAISFAHQLPGQLLRYDAVEAAAWLTDEGLADTAAARALIEAIRTRPRARRRLRVRDALADNGTMVLREQARLALELACARDRLPVSWLDDGGSDRRFLAPAHEWSNNAMFEDRRDAQSMMSLPFLPARLLARIEDTLGATITAERLARDERGARTVYYREANAESFALLRALRSGVATDRERAIFDCGYALDPLIPWAAVLWIETGAGPSRRSW